MLILIHFTLLIGTSQTVVLENLPTLSSISNITLRTTWITYSISKSLSKQITLEAVINDSYVLNHTFPQPDVSELDTSSILPSDGLTIYNLPSYGRGFLTSLTFFVIDPGAIKVYFLEKTTNCSEFTEEWMCSGTWSCPSEEAFYDCDLFEDMCETEGSEIEDLFLADMFVINQTLQLNLTETNSLQTLPIEIDISIKKGYFIAVASIDAKLKSYKHNPANSSILNFPNYATGSLSEYNPFIKLELHYLNDQDYKLSFDGQSVSVDFNSLVLPIDWEDALTDYFSLSITGITGFESTVLQIAVPDGWADLLTAGVQPSWFAGSITMDPLDTDTFIDIMDFVKPEGDVGVEDLILCISNCNNDSVIQTTNMVLRVNFELIALDVIDSVDWELYSYQTNDNIISSYVTTMSDISVSLKTDLLAAENYRIILNVTATNGTVFGGMLKIKVSDIVYNMSCTVTPNNGTALHTTFTFSCSLTGDGISCPNCDGTNGTTYIYDVQQCLDTDCEMVKPLITLTSDQASGDLVLSMGFSELNYKAVIQVIVSTNYNDHQTFIQSKQYDSIVTAVPGALDNSADTFLDLFRAPGVFRSFLDSNNTIGALNYINSAMSLIDGIPARSHLNAEMLHILDQIPVTNSKEAESMLSVINSITSDNNNIDGASQRYALNKARSLVSIISDQGVHSSTGTRLLIAVSDNIINSNAALAGIDLVPDFNNFMFLTKAPDAEYYDKWVNFDYEAEEKEVLDTNRTAETSNGVIDVTKIIAELMCDSMGGSGSATMTLQNVTFEYGTKAGRDFGESSHLIGSQQMLLPPIEFTGIGSLEPICYRYVELRNNPFIMIEQSERVRSKVVVFDASDADKAPVIIKKVNGLVEVLVPRKHLSNIPIYSVRSNNMLYFVTDVFISGQSQLFLHLELESETDMLTIYLREETLPTVNNFDYKFSSSDAPASGLLAVEEGKFGISSGDRNKSVLNLLLQGVRNGTYHASISINNDNVNETYFGMAPFATSCLALDDNGKAWIPSNTTIGILTDSTRTQCQFKSMAYYSADFVMPKISLYVEPPPVQIIEESVLKILGCIPVLILFVVYHLSYRLAKTFDRQDTLSCLQNILPGFESTHQQQLIVTIKTGIRIGAGTTSNVGIILYGSNKKQKTVLIKNGNSLFDLNGANTFLASSNEYLGAVEKISVWTDYSGSSPDWYLDSIRITSSGLEQDTSVVSNFNSNRWIGYKEDKVGCMLKKEKVKKGNFAMFWNLWKEQLFNHNMWFSFLTKFHDRHPSRFMLLTSSFFRCILMLLVIITFDELYREDGEGFEVLRENDFILATIALVITLPLILCLEKSMIYLSSNPGLASFSDNKHSASFNQGLETLIDNKHGVCDDSIEASLSFEDYFDITRKVDDLSLERSGGAKIEKGIAFEDVSLNMRDDKKIPLIVPLSSVSDLKSASRPQAGLTRKKSEFHHNNLYPRLSLELQDLNGDVIEKSSIDENPASVQCSVSIDEYFNITAPLIEPHNPHSIDPPCSEYKQAPTGFTIKSESNEKKPKLPLSLELQDLNGGVIEKSSKQDFNNGNPASVQCSVSIDEYFNITAPLIEPHNPHSIDPPCSECKKLPIGFAIKSEYDEKKPNLLSERHAGILLKFYRRFLTVLHSLAMCGFAVLGYMSSITQVLTVVKCLFLALLLSVGVEQMVVITFKAYWHTRMKTKALKNFQTRRESKKMNSEDIETVEPPTLLNQLFQNKKRLDIVALKIVGYAFFITIVVTLANNDRQTSSYWLNKSVHDEFGGKDFGLITNKETYWPWVRDKFIPSLHVAKGLRTEDGSTANYIAGGKSILISIARLRQVRIKDSNCTVNSTETCHAEYRSDLEDKTDYTVSWDELVDVPEQSFSKQRYLSYWNHSSPEELYGYSVWGKLAVYPGSGYVVSETNFMKMSISQQFFSKHVSVVFQNLLNVLVRLQHLLF